MKKTALAIALLAMMGASTAVWAQVQEQRSAKVGQCAGLQPADIAAQVKRDFLQNRITRWEADKKLLGTATPIAWVSPDAITGKEQVWQVPLTVRGTKVDKTYNVTLNCNTGEIAYSAPQ
ncbi:protein YebF [Serratia marcescens]|uniref:protein YebF n=1 Tax=Serratia marcescens TaxID=615 RepID=UPI0013D92617|nr:protein YebF [Serratia marcescens]